MIANIFFCDLLAFWQFGIIQYFFQLINMRWKAAQERTASKVKNPPVIITTPYQQFSSHISTTLVLNCHDAQQISDTLHMKIKKYLKLQYLQQILRKCFQCKKKSSVTFSKMKQQFWYTKVLMICDNILWISLTNSTVHKRSKCSLKFPTTLLFDTI